MFIFLGLCLWLVWVLAGWPMWLAWRAKRWPKPFVRGDIQPGISVIVCVRNGAVHLRRKLESLLSLDYPRERMEIFVVSDGSTDATCDIAREFAGQGVRLVEKEYGGKPAALNAALPLAKNEIVLITDVRQVLETQSVRRLVAGFADPQVGVISGELLILRGDTGQEMNIGAYWRFESWIRQQLSLVDSMLGATGPFYAIRRDLVRHPVPPETLLDDVYIPLGAFFRGYRLVMEPAAKAFDYPTSLETEFRRKVRTLAGNYQLLRFYPELLGMKNRLWLDYVSYKLGRLLLPFVLIGLLITTVWLPAGWREAAWLAQGVAYGLALVDGWLPEGWPLKKASAAARTFAVMMAAALCGISVWFLPAQRLWVPTQTPARKV